MKGRKPTPTSLKVLSGTRSDRVNAAEPAPPPGRPEPPARFDEATKAQWGAVCDALESMGVLSPTHGFALEVYCGAYARLLIAERALAEHGALLITTRGGDDGSEGDVVIKSNPAAAVAAQCETIMTRILTEFGLTAASVSKVKARDDGPKDKLAELLAKRRKA